jgi:hypothetical protein
MECCFFKVIRFWAIYRHTRFRGPTRPDTISRQRPIGEGRDPCQPGGYRSPSFRPLRRAPARPGYAEYWRVESRLQRSFRIQCLSWGDAPGCFDIAPLALNTSMRKHVAPTYATRPQQFLYFFPLPQGQGSLRPTFGPPRRTGRSSFISPAPSPFPPAIAIAGCG